MICYAYMQNRSEVPKFLMSKTHKIDAKQSMETFFLEDCDLRNPI